MPISRNAVVPASDGQAIVSNLASSLMQFWPLVSQQVYGLSILPLRYMVPSRYVMHLSRPILASFGLVFWGTALMSAVSFYSWGAAGVVGGSSDEPEIVESQSGSVTRIWKWMFGKSSDSSSGEKTSESRVSPNLSESLCPIDESPEEEDPGSVFKDGRKKNVSWQPSELPEGGASLAEMTTPIQNRLSLTGRSRRDSFGSPSCRGSAEPTDSLFFSILNKYQDGGPDISPGNGNAGRGFSSIGLMATPERGKENSSVEYSSVNAGSKLTQQNESFGGSSVTQGQTTGQANARRSRGPRNSQGGRRRTGGSVTQR